MAPFLSSCLVPHTQPLPDWRTVCPLNSSYPVNSSTSLTHATGCCASKPCGLHCRGSYKRNQMSSNCSELPDEFVRRSFTIGSQGGALTRMRRRLRACNGTLHIAAAGGSVTAGPGAMSWANYMAASLKNDKRLTAKLSKLAANGVGPAYLSACWEHHFSEDAAPDIAILEYAVNDIASTNVDMEGLVRRLLVRDTIVVLLHHFSPAFISGGTGYKNGLMKDTAEVKHSLLTQHYALSSISFGEAVGLSKHSAAWSRAAAAHKMHTASQPVRTTSGAILHPCSFMCSLFTDDGIHPNTCGQKMLGTLATHALRKVLHLDSESGAHRTTSSTRGAPDLCRSNSGRNSEGSCVQLPAPLSWDGRKTGRTVRGYTGTDSRSGEDVETGTLPKGTSAGRRAQAMCATVAKCWSNVGPPASWNLKPARNVGFKLVDLKSNSRLSVPGGGKVMKMLWEGRYSKAFVEFKLSARPKYTARYG